MSGQFDTVLKSVTTQQDNINELLEDAINQYSGEALAAIHELRLSGVNLANAGFAPSWVNPALDAATAPRLTPQPDAPALPSVSDPTQGVVIGTEVSDAVKAAVDAVVVPAVPTPVMPSAPSVNFPSAPAMSSIADPGDVPVLADVPLPSAPVLASPALPTLDDVVVPTFTFPTLPEFDADAPLYAPPETYVLTQEVGGRSAISMAGQVVYNGGRYDLLGAGGTALFSAVYQNMQDVITLRGTGVSPAVEQAMFDSAKAREDELTLAEVDEVTSRWASRGFSLPAGVLDSQIQKVRDANMLKSRSLSRDVMLKRAGQELDMLKFTMGQALAAEQFMFAVYEATTKQQLDALQAVNSVNAQLVDSGVKVFNAQSSLVQLQADIWKTNIEAKFKEVDMFRAKLEAAKAVGELNQQKVQMYVAMYEGVKAEVGVYTAKLTGVQAQLQAQQSKIDGYRAKVQAYSERQQAERVKMDTYTAQVNAERSKVDIYDSQAKVYLGQLDAVLRTGDMGIKKAETLARARSGDLQAYDVKVRASTARMQADVAELEALNRQFMSLLEANTRGNELEVNRYKAEIEARATNLRNAVDAFTAQTQAYTGRVSALATAAKVSTDAASSAGQLGSQVAMGALSAMHVSASIGIGGSVTDDSPQ